LVTENNFQRVYLREGKNPSESFIGGGESAGNLHLKKRPDRGGPEKGLRQGKGKAPSFVTAVRILRK